MRISPLHPLKLLQQRTIPLGRLAGIPLNVDVNWLPMAFLHWWLVTQFWLRQQATEATPEWQLWVLGAVATAFFFGSILAHELGHALIARRAGLQIYDIQLHLFGGWARLIGEPPTALAEFRIAIAGPLSSLALAFTFWLLALFPSALGATAASLWQVGASALRYLAVANLTLALFNLLPGLPLDGGRALRAWLWHRRKDVVAATKTATQTGVIIAYLVMGYGVFLFAAGAWRQAAWQDALAGGWLLLVGKFLKNAAETDYRQRVAQTAQAGQTSTISAGALPTGATIHAPIPLPTPNNASATAGTVSAAMQTPVISVAPELRINEFVDQILTRHRLTLFPVAHADRLHGILDLAQLRQQLEALPRSDWERLTIREMMLPVAETHFIAARASLAQAQQKLAQSGLPQIAVLDDEGKLVGMFGRQELRQAA